MSSIDLHAIQLVKKDLKFALERKQQAISSETIPEILRNSSPNHPDYWELLAHELLRQEQFNDSLDCWLEAEKYIAVADDEHHYFYQDMISTLSSTTNVSFNRYFCDIAINICKKLIETDPTESGLNLVLELLQSIGHPVELILSTIDRILDNAFEVKVHIDPAELGLPEYASPEISGYKSLADWHLWLGNFGEAFRCWSRVLKSTTDEESNELCEVIYSLLWFAVENGLNEAKFLPDEFEKIQH